MVICSSKSHYLGKGTQCRSLASEYGKAHISIGELLRKELTLKSDVGDALAKTMENGLLAPMVNFHF